MLQAIKIRSSVTVRYVLVLFVLIAVCFMAYKLLFDAKPLTDAQIVSIASKAVSEYAKSFQLDVGKFVLVKAEYFDNSDRWLVTYESPYPDANNLFVIVRPDKDYEVSMRPAVKHQEHK